MCLHSKGAEGVAAFSSQESNGEDAEVTIFLSDPFPEATRSIYNVPDGAEGDSEIIRSELMFYSTPRTEQWSPYVYASLSNIQEQCGKEFEMLCDPEEYLKGTFKQLNSLYESKFTNDFFGLSSLLFQSDSPMALFNAQPISMHMTNERPQSISSFVFEDPELLFSDSYTRKLVTTLSDGKRMINKLRAIYRSELRDTPIKINDVVQEQLYPGTKNMKGIEDVVLNVRGKPEKNSEAAGNQRGLFVPVVPKHTVLPSNGVTNSVHAGHSATVGSNVRLNDKALLDIDIKKSKDIAPLKEPLKGEHKFPVKALLPRRNLLKTQMLDMDATADIKQEQDYGHHQEHEHEHEQHRPDHEEPHHENYNHDDFTDSSDYSDHHHRPAISEDVYFAGALGFGANGDQCMYKNFDNLSQGCKNAIVDLHTLREKYWEQDQTIEYKAQSHENCGFIWFLLFFIILVVSFFKRRRRNKKAKETNKFLDAIRSNEALKESVEKNTGLSIPAPIVAEGCCAKNDVRGDQPGCFAKTLKVLALFFVVVFSSFIISVSSLEITASILNALDGDNASSDSPPTSPFAALIVLILICSIEVGIFFLLVKAVKSMLASRRGTNNNNSHDGSSEYGCMPTAPTVSDGAQSSLIATSRNGVFTNNVNAFRAYTMSAFNRPKTPVYSPLNNQSVHSMDGTVHGAPVTGLGQAEMVTVNPYPLHARPVSHVSYV